MIKLKIDLTAISNNYELVKNNLAPNVIASAVVKANAYGLGAKLVSNCLYNAGCRHFWVATIDEGIELRSVLPQEVTIYILQGFQKEQLDTIRYFNFIPVINSLHEFYQIQNQDVAFTLFFDTGLNRLGIRQEDTDYILQNIQGEKIDCVMSHLSDPKQLTSSNNQKEIFDSLVKKVKQIIPEVKATLAASDGMCLENQSYQYDMVRVGGFLYGQNTKIKPYTVVTLSGKVLQIHTVKAGSHIGYGQYFKAQTDMQVAIVGIGYADGILRSLSNKGVVLLNGMYAPIVGVISMDSLICDISNISVEIGQAAYLLNEIYTINEMAQDSQTCASNILTSLRHSNRVNVIYN